ncbi:hypothetical protein PRIPAC_89224, partial [Pristionchus pacificus]|uniref:Homeobox domain-containing protein n=1 Tax=Pristionchus pacificus TaxID=54126 RepID=A0A8R1UGR7_PRIPA
FDDTSISFIESSPFIRSVMNALFSLSVFIAILLLPDRAHAAAITSSSGEAIVKPLNFPKSIILSPTNNTDGESIEYTITAKEPAKEEHSLKLSMKGGWRTKGFVSFFIVFVILAYIFVATVLRWIVRRLERLCGCTNDHDGGGLALSADGLKGCRLIEHFSSGMADTQISSTGQPAFSIDELQRTEETEDVQQTTKKRRIRTSFTQLQLMVLEEAFLRQQYMIKAERMRLAESLGLNQIQARQLYSNTQRIKYRFSR